MKSERLLNIIGEIDERHIVEAFPVEKRQSRWVNWAAAVACLCLVVFGTLIAYRNGFVVGLTGATTLTEKSEYNQLVIVNNALDDGYLEPINIQLTNTRQGLCLSDTSDDPNGVFESITANIAPGELARQETDEMSLEEAKEYAYLDYDSATDEMRERILEARKIIIFNSNWVADGYSGCIQNVKTGEIIETLPTFSELFPDWDIPRYTNENESITADGLGADSLYGLQMSIVQINETFMICAVQDRVNMFEEGQRITVYLPDRTSIDTLNLKVGDLIFVSYFGKNCDVLNCSINAEAIETR